MKLGKHSILKKPLEPLAYNAEDLRWATPEIVADYRAKRLKCQVIADLGCGIGFQALAFAKTCHKVYAVDVDHKKLNKAKKNAQLLGIKNIIFIHGDALDSKIAKQVADS